jgi:hypothetical protein
MPRTLLVVALLSLAVAAGCSGDDGGEDGDDGGSSATELANRVCEVLRDTHDRLGDDATASAYLAEFATGMAVALSAPQQAEITPAVEDDVRALCGDELDRFFEEAGVSSLGGG